jgi:hypothetical protein
MKLAQPKVVCNAYEWVFMEGRNCVYAEMALFGETYRKKDPCKKFESY